MTILQHLGLSRGVRELECLSVTRNGQPGHPLSQISMLIGGLLGILAVAVGVGVVTWARNR